MSSWGPSPSFAKDRCLVTFREGANIQSKRAALQAIVREWIRLL